MRLIVFSVFIHAVVGWRLMPALSAWPLGLWLLVLALPTTSVLIPGGLAWRRRLQPPWSDRLAWAGYLSLGFFSTLLVLTVLRDLAGGLLMLASWWWPTADPAALAAPSALAVAAGALGATLGGLWNARRTARVTQVDLPIAGLPPALHGFTIAQLSDIHVGATIKRTYLQAIVARVNALQPDLVAITGDLVDGSVRDLSRHVQALSDLKSRNGTYFVTGNHEYYSGAQAWITELRRLGLTVLLNEHVVIDRDGQQLVLGGVTDFSAHHFDDAHRSDPQASLAGAPPGAAVRLLLAHQPRSAEAAERAGFDVQLSGHTHGGQFWPWNLFVPLQQPYTAGLHRLGRLRIYVSRGTGYWGPPKRLGAPSEITQLRLVPA